MSDSTIPHLESSSKESCIRWLFFLFNKPLKDEEMNDMIQKDKNQINSWVEKEIGVSLTIRTELSDKPLSNNLDVITEKGIVPVKKYLEPSKQSESLSLPSFGSIINQLRSVLKGEEFNRLIQITSISYPSPIPVIGAILRRYNKDWEVLFKNDPDVFCECIQNSGVFIRKNYSFRSFHYCFVSSKHVMKIIIKKMNT